MLIECVQQQIEYIEPERMNEWKALKRMICAKRVEKDSKPSGETEEESQEDIFNKGI